MEKQNKESEAAMTQATQKKGEEPSTATPSAADNGAENKPAESPADNKAKEGEKKGEQAKGTGKVVKKKMTSRQFLAKRLAGLTPGEPEHRQYFFLRISLSTHWEQAALRCEPTPPPPVYHRHGAGMVGADIQALCNEAAIFAARQNADAIELKHFEAALDRVIGGLERKTRRGPGILRSLASHPVAALALPLWILDTTPALLVISL